LRRADGMAYRLYRLFDRRRIKADKAKSQAIAGDGKMVLLHERGTALLHEGNQFLGTGEGVGGESAMTQRGVGSISGLL